MEADTTRRDGRRRWLAAGTLCLTPFLMVLMFQGAQVALPAVQRGLHLSAAELQWVVSANTLAFGLLLLPAGRVGDLVGHRRLFCLGMGVVALASLACGLAQDPAVLIAARAVQGVGAAMATPSALALLTAAFQVGPARNLALGVWGAAGPIGGIVGLAAGGLLAATLGWSAVFLCAAPPAALALLLGRVLLDDHRPPAAARRLDIRGLVRPGLGCAVLVTLALAAAANTPLFFFTLYMQQVEGASPLLAALAFLPANPAIVLGSAIASRLATRWGVWPTAAAGMAALALGPLLLIRTSVHGGYLQEVLPALIALGLGLGLAQVATMIAGMDAVAAEDRGTGAGVLQSTMQVGTALGLALLSVIAAPPPLVDGLHAAFGAEALIAAMGAAMAGLVALAVGRAVSGRDADPGPASEGGGEGVVAAGLEVADGIVADLHQAAEGKGGDGPVREQLGRLLEAAVAPGSAQEGRERPPVPRVPIAPGQVGDGDGQEERHRRPQGEGYGEMLDRRLRLRALVEEGAAGVALEADGGAVQRVADDGDSMRNGASERLRPAVEGLPRAGQGGGDDEERRDQVVEGPADERAGGRPGEKEQVEQEPPEASGP